MNKTPHIMNLGPGLYHFCACGRSGNLPFCDGTHHGSGFEPFAVEITELKTVAVCSCGQSSHRPFCDGTHNTLKSS